MSDTSAVELQLSAFFLPVILLIPSLNFNFSSNQCIGNNRASRVRHTWIPILAYDIRKLFEFYFQYLLQTQKM